MGERSNPFADWLNATLQSRNLSQAQLARAVGVADTQVSRWRRGQVVPTVRYLQQLADTLDVPRSRLDRLAGYPVGDGSGEAPATAAEATEEAELQAYGAQFRHILEASVPRHLWAAYVEACDALAASLVTSFQRAAAGLQDAQDAPVDDSPAVGTTQDGERNVGFRP